jgi:predicted anti-sigma-YlaC factor YlaD
MHEPIRDGLEELLAAKGTGREDREFEKHLSSCGKCRGEVEAMRAQAELLHAWRAPQELEPAPGFYARVMQRIEERAKESMWAPFIYSAFAKRLTYASLAATLLLGSYVISHETLDGHLGGTPNAPLQFHRDMRVMGSRQQQREAVLVNFISHPGTPR